MSKTILEARLIHFKHKNGSKDYHLMMIPLGDGRSLVAKRWGKTGSVGQFGVFTNDEYRSESLFAKEYDNRNARGYEVFSDLRHPIGFRGVDPNFDRLIGDFGSERWTKFLSSVGFDLIEYMRAIEAERRDETVDEETLRETAKKSETRPKKEKPAHYGTW
jgi:predicted DNA-binding WGR domain protein